MSNGFKFNWNWEITQVDAGEPADFYEPTGNVDKLNLIDTCLDIKLMGGGIHPTEKTITDFKLTKEDREYLIIKWAAHFDTEFYSRDKFYMRGKHLNSILNFDSPFNQVDGYGAAGERLAREFIDHGLDLRVSDSWTVQNNLKDIDPRVLGRMNKQFDSRPGTIGIRFSNPLSFHACPGEFKIGFSMWEFPEFPSDWVSGANGIDLNFVPCGWNRLLWEKGGVTKPVITIPLGVHPIWYPYIERPLDRNPYTFLADGTILGGGTFSLVDAFKKLFYNNPNVRLILKILPREIRQTSQDGNITIIQGKLSMQEMQDWYASGDCFLYPTTAEGFGLFPLEAMATGLPVIITDMPATKTFVRPDICYPIPYTYEWYHYPDMDFFGKQMEYVYTHKEEASIIGKNASSFVQTHLTWRKAVEKIIQVLR